MNVRKLSVNKACIFFAVLLLVAMGTVSAALYGLTQNITAVWYVLLFGIFCAGLRRLFYGAGSPQTGNVLRCFLQFNG